MSVETGLPLDALGVHVAEGDWPRVQQTYVAYLNWRVAEQDKSRR